MKTLLTFISLSIFFVSCTDVIEIELKDMDPKLVVEAVINDIDKQCTLKLTKTADYFNPEANSAVSDAVITISDENGARADFIEIEPGVYVEDSIYGKPNTSYTLNIYSEGIEYTATAHIPSKVNIDLVSYELNPLSIFYDEGYVITCHFSDPFESTNFYRLKTYNLNDSTKAKGNNYVDNDDLFNGNSTEIPWDFEVYEAYDTIVMELYTLDESTYKYYNTLFSLTDESTIMSAATPANPVTNIDNDALGFFGAYTLSIDTIVIIPSDK